MKKSKKALSFILTLCVVVSCFSFAVFASNHTTTHRFDPEKIENHLKLKASAEVEGADVTLKGQVEVPEGCHAVLELYVKQLKSLMGGSSGISHRIVASEKFSIDGNGELVEKTVTFPSFIEGDFFASATVYIYDENGNLIDGSVFNTDVNTEYDFIVFYARLGK